MSTTIREGYGPGCIGRIAELHASYYHRTAGFGLAFERKVALELADFCDRYVAGRDGLWLALGDGRIEGSIAIDGSHAARDGAHLRRFIVSDAARGRGVGGRLLDAAMAFCCARDYDRACLWTFEGLDAARHLYEKAGFGLVHPQRGRQWGTEVNEQRFERRGGASARPGAGSSSASAAES
jgi:GNAT superfamily N-acetyltransferase